MTTHILLIAHAPLASALRDCVGHVFAERMGTVVALDVQASDAAETVLQQARHLRQGMGAEDVLVLTDVMGATPCNVAAKLVKDTQDKHVCGVNLPMLWRAVAYQHEPLAQVVKRAIEGGQQGVMMPP
jgi:PTS system ascorbate-specific IIA component